jgi:N-acetylated-alpha-linked acidic dipeptidase
MLDNSRDVDDYPIPSYDQAVNGHDPTNNYGTTPVLTDEADSQPLLPDQNGTEARHGRAATSMQRNSNYHQPTVESVRSSFDSDVSIDTSELGSSRGHSNDLGREFLDLEIEDPLGGGHSPSERLRFWLQSWVWKLGLDSTRFWTFWDVPYKFIVSKWRKIRNPENPRLALIHFVRLMTLLVILSIIYLLFASDISPMSGKKAITGAMFDPEAVKQYIQEKLENSQFDGYLSRLSSFDHVAGTEGDLTLAKWVERHFKAGKLDDVEINEYNVYLNYPRAGGRQLSIISPESAKWDAALEEKTVLSESNDHSGSQTQAFHGYSKSGNVTGPLLYANLGSESDYTFLAKNSIDVHGKIVLIRTTRDGHDTSAQIQRAQDHGAIGCILANLRTETGEHTFQLPNDAVQRASAALSNVIMGDVLTPGKPSLADVPRLPLEGNPGLVKIPSLPISWQDAQVLLTSISSHGQSVPSSWKTADNPHVWRTGDDSSPIVLLRNEQDEVEQQPIWNVMGKIKGAEQPEKKIIIGSHRDAWCLGASSPGSGTAIMLELIQVFSGLMELGWRPRRTIVFANWDGSEFNHIGATEWVEENIQDLRLNGMAYINAGAAISGPDFHVTGSPALRQAILRAANRVLDPTNNKTLKDTAASAIDNLEKMNVESDYTPFQFLTGVSSIDIAYRGPAAAGSCYDTFDRLQDTIDTGFAYHRSLAQVWALLILELSDSYIMANSMVDYSTAILSHIQSLTKDISQSKIRPSDNGQSLDIEPLRKAAIQFVKQAEGFDSWENDWASDVYGSGGYESSVTAIHRQSHNSRISNFESHLLDLSADGGVSFF